MNYLADLRHDLQDEEFAVAYLSACAKEGDDTLRIGIQEVLAALHKEGAGGVCGQPILPGLCEYTCTKEPGHAGEHNWVLGELLARMVAPLPLQRTLPDEQFKGAVVERIGVEKAQWELGQELSDSIGAYAVALARRQDGESADDEEIGAAIKRCVAAKRAWDAAASPAGRAEEKEQG